MPAKVSVNARPMVTAGLAKLVELVNQYAAPMYAPPAAGAGQGEDEQDQPGGGDDLAEPQVAGGPVFAGEVDGGQGEHEVGQDRPGDGPDGLRGRTSGEVPAGEPGAGTPVEEPVRGRDDRVEVHPGHRPEDQDQRAERERGRDRVSSNCRPMSCGDNRAAMTPEPTTAVTSRAVPQNSARKRRHGAWWAIRGTVRGHDRRGGGRGRRQGSATRCVCRSAPATSS